MLTWKRKEKMKKSGTCSNKWDKYTNFLPEYYTTNSGIFERSRYDTPQTHTHIVVGTSILTIRPLIYLEYMQALAQAHTSCNFIKYDISLSFALCLGKICILFLAFTEFFSPTLYVLVMSKFISVDLSSASSLSLLLLDLSNVVSFYAFAKLNFLQFCVCSLEVLGTKLT